MNSHLYEFVIKLANEWDKLTHSHPLLMLVYWMCVLLAFIMPTDGID